jgi:hypothetical protein
VKTLTALVIGLVVSSAPPRAQSQAPPPVTTAVPPPSVNPRAEIVNDFKKRVDAYVELRKKIDDGAPKQKETKAAGDIHVAQQALAERIKAGRAAAKQGDIFTPQIAAEFRRLMHPEIKEKGTKELIKEPTDKPPDVPFTINGSYPDKQPLATSPPNVLANLPPLAKDLEIDYRFVGKHLILRDSRANLIIDYMLNAIP